jgi:hypothetical protein
MNTALKNHPISNKDCDIAESHIHAQLSALDRELSRIEENLTNLAGRLDPIRTPNAMKTESGDQTPQEMLSPIGNRLRGLTARAQGLVRFSNDLSQNLEI